MSQLQAARTPDRNCLKTLSALLKTSQERNISVDSKKYKIQSRLMQHNNTSSLDTQMAIKISK